MSEELKPCPFCGSEVYTFKLYFDEYGVSCNNIDCPVFANEFNSWETEEEAIRAWNTRRKCEWIWKPYKDAYETECDNLAAWQPDGLPRYCPNCGGEVVESGQRY